MKRISFAEYIHVNCYQEIRKKIEEDYQKILSARNIFGISCQMAGKKEEEVEKHFGCSFQPIVEMYEYGIRDVIYKNSDDSTFILFSCLCDVELQSYEWTFYAERVSAYTLERHFDKAVVGYEVEFVWQSRDDIAVKNVSLGCELLEDSYSNFFWQKGDEIPQRNSLEMDVIAKAFIEEYCPEVLTTESLLSEDKLVEKMDIQLFDIGWKYYTEINFRLHDSLYFRFLGKENRWIQDGDQILIRKKMNNSGYSWVRRFLIVRGCCYIYLSRKIIHFYQLISSFNNNWIESSIAFNESDAYMMMQNTFLSSEDLVRLKWQANQLAYRVLLPDSHFVQKYYELESSLIKAQKRTFSSDLEKRSLDDLIVQNLAMYFEVPIDIVEKKIITASPKSMDIPKLSNNITQKDDIKENRVPNIDPLGESDLLRTEYSYEIEPELATQEKKRNYLFGQLVEDELFVRVKNMYVINHTKYIEVGDDSTYQLTDYAKDHLEECCLTFTKIHIDLQIASSPIRTNKEDATQLRLLSGFGKYLEKTDKIEGKIFDAGRKENFRIIVNAYIMISMKEIVETASQEYKKYSHLPSLFCDTLKFHRKARHLTFEQLAEATKISDRMLKKYEKNDHIKKSIEKILALCRGLNLSPIFSYDLIRKAGYDITIPYPKNIIIRYLIDTHSRDTVSEWDKLLEESEAGFSITKTKSNI